MTTANQISGYTYDSAGNLDTIPGTGGITFTYNGENELTTSSAGVTYTGVYPERRRRNGDGNRVEKSSGTVYWYGAGTEILDESNTSGTITNEYVFFGGKRVAMRNVTSGTIYYYEEDMLGSSRTLVQVGQTSVCYDADFYPFGGERDITNTCTQHYKFEGKERDTETGNDDFGARYYTSRLGRWLSADWSAVPAAVPYANLTNPQTLNLYAMVSDNPETFADLDGHLSGTEGLCWVDFCAGSTQTEAARQGDGPPQPNTGTGTGTSTTQQAQRQLSVADAIKIIQAAEAGGGDPVSVGMQIFNNLGSNVSVTGDVLRQALNQAGVKLEGAGADLISHADSISKSGNSVTIASASSYATKQDGNTLHVDKVVSFNVGSKGGLPTLTGIRGLTVDNQKHNGISINEIAVEMHVFAKGSPPRRALAIYGSKAYGMFKGTEYHPIQ